jgi:hypothetical protein
MDPTGQGVQAVLPSVGEGEAATYVPGGHEEQAVAPGVGQDTGGEYCPPELQYVVASAVCAGEVGPYLPAV